MSLFQQERWINIGNSSVHHPREQGMLYLGITYLLKVGLSQNGFKIELLQRECISVAHPVCSQLLSDISVDGAAAS